MEQQKDGEKNKPIYRSPFQVGEFIVLKEEHQKNSGETEKLIKEVIALKDFGANKKRLTRQTQNDTYIQIGNYNVCVDSTRFRKANWAESRKAKMEKLFRKEKTETKTK